MIKGQQRPDPTIDELESEVEALAKIIVDQKAKIFNYGVGANEQQKIIEILTKERDELRADNLSLVNRLEQECARLGMVTAELKAWTEQEPVAWRYKTSNDVFRYRGYKRGFGDEYAILRPVPLYTKPKDAKSDEQSSNPLDYVSDGVLYASLSDKELVRNIIKSVEHIDYLSHVSNIDCRTCAYYSNHECMKPKHGFNACVKADLYKATGILQLWVRR
jgi:hypothetical protein